MKIAVVFYRTLSSQSAASLSAGYIAAYLREKGHTAELFLIKKEQDNSDIAPVLSESWDYIFYKPNFKDFDRLETNLNKMNEKCPSAKIIMFGPLSFINSEILLNRFPLIYGIMKPNSEPSLPDDSSYITRENNNAPINCPMFDYSLCPARDIEKSEDLKIVNIEASRGCNHCCSFCHVGLISKITNQKVISRPPNEVIKEIKDLILMGKKYFIFNDSVLGGGGMNGQRWLLEFCDLANEIKEKIYFMAYLTLNDIKNKETIEMLSKHNFIRVFVGIESANKTSLQSFNKSIDVTNYFRIKSLLKDNFITSHIGFMLFHPYVSLKEIDEGIDYLYQHDEIHRFGVINEKSRVINRTELHRKTKLDGLLSSDNGISFDYKFKEAAVNTLYKSYQDTFKEIDVPLLERIEHLFVCAEFINNLLLKEYTKTVNSYEKIIQIRRDFSKSFHTLLKSLNQGLPVLPTTEHEYYKNIWQDLEAAFQDLLIEAKKDGLSNPLEWIASGNCDPEPDKTDDYDGKTTKTRSGEIRI